MARTTFTDTMDQLYRLIPAGYPVIYLVSHEELRVFDCVARIVNRLRVKDPSKTLLRWVQGPAGLECFPLGEPSDEPNWLKGEGLTAGRTTKIANTGEPEQAIWQILEGQKANSPELCNSVTVLFDFHPHLGQDPSGIAGAMVRPLRNAADKLRIYYDAGLGKEKHNYQTLIIVAPTDKHRSMELSRDVVTLDFPLPETDELSLVLEDMVARKFVKFPSPVPAEDLKQVCGEGQPAGAYADRVVGLLAAAGRGLTMHAYKQGLNMIRNDGDTILPKHISFMERLKADTIGAGSPLEYFPKGEIELGGLSGIKSWVAVRRAAATNAAIRKMFYLPPPKGVFLGGASGGGKSRLALLIAKEFNLALLRLDVGSLFASYVGESERLTREALQLAELLSPIVLWIDEIDKGMAGASGAANDSGVAARVFGFLLTWLGEKRDEVFVVVTANDFEKILTPFPEFGRKGRFDELFWVGLPLDEARAQILTIYLRPHVETGYLNLGAGSLDSLVQVLVGKSGKMTGAEIESAVHEALYEAYEIQQRVAGARPFNPALLAGVMDRCRLKSLYNGSENENLDKLRAKAADRKWLDAETGLVVA